MKLISVPFLSFSFFFQILIGTLIYTHTHITDNGINSATCRDTYGLPDYLLGNKQGGSESRAFCTSEYSDISPLRDGNIAFSTLEGRPSAIKFEHSNELQVYTQEIIVSLY